VRQLHGAQRVRSFRGGLHIQRLARETAKATFAGNYEDTGALEMLNEPVKPVHAFNPLVQINAQNAPLEETRV
jgi:hypothetical protein